MRYTFTKKRHVFLAATFMAMVVATIILWQVSAIAQCAPVDLTCMNLP